MPTDDEIKKIQAENEKLKTENDKLKTDNSALKSEKGQAETDKAIAEAQRAAILAQIPQSDSKALEGKVTVDAGAVTEIQRLAHVAMSEVVQKMAKDIKEARHDLSTVILYNERDMGSLANYRTVAGEFSLLMKGYREALVDQTPAVAAHGETEGAGLMMISMPLLVPFVAGSALKSIIDVISLFRTNVDIKGAAVTFDEASLVAEVAKHLREAYKPSNQSAHKATGPSEKGFEVVYSTLFVPGLLAAHDSQNSMLLKDIEALAAMRQESAIAVAAFDAKSADAQSADPERERMARLKALNARYDRLLQGLGQIDDKTNISALTMLLRGELLARKTRGDRSAILLVKANGGGENRITQNLWRGGKLYHCGTAILTYLLFTNEGDLILSDVLSRTTNFVEAKLV